MHGIPEEFTFTLTNVSRHNVWVPDPTVECSDTIGGYFWLGIELAPLLPSGSESREGCVVDRIDPPILERAQDWKVLAPGEVLKKTASRSQLRNKVEYSGKYEFWAEYYPPYLGPTDQQSLRERGIDFPTEKLTTSRLTFVTSH